MCTVVYCEPTIVSTVVHLSPALLTVIAFATTGLLVADNNPSNKAQEDATRRGEFKQHYLVPTLARSDTPQSLIIRSIFVSFHQTVGVLSGLLSPRTTRGIVENTPAVSTSDGGL